MPWIDRKRLFALVAGYVVVVLLWGYFLAQQLLLSVYIAILGALFGGLAYVTWQYFGSSGGKTGKPQA